MPIADLQHHQLLELDPDGGTIRFAGQRALLVDAVAMGLLRSYLVQNFGLTAAKAILTQFGFAHGWRMAKALRDEFDWPSETEWRLAGTQLCTLEGLFRPQPGSEDPLGESGQVLLASYEAEQHLLHFGRADSAVCWTIGGLISGYVSRIAGNEIYVLEDRCLAQGHAACHFVARSRDAWGPERAPDLAFFDESRLKECLDVSLSRVTESLKATEESIRSRRRDLADALPEKTAPRGILVQSAAMQRVVELAQRVARVDAAVLITGESGAGKERIARLVHEESARRGGPFVAVNCGAIPESLLESELFGHKRGAFTGANADRPGLFEAASAGTLLLDEIGEISPAMQVKLLRVLQEREVRRVGENSSRSINVRVIAATNRDLASGVQDGGFREDLYYRLKVVELEVPPLRDRKEDILPLSRLFLREASLRMGREVTELGPRVADQILRHSWPGNVRELENAMERAAALARGGQVELEDLPSEVRDAFPGSEVNADRVRPLRDVERDYILAVLELNAGNQTRTADQLQIGTATLYRKLKRYALEAESAEAV